MYEEGLEGRLADLHDRVHSGAYRATPSRRVNIPKPDGGTRPLGVAAIEDKIVQKAVAEIILTPIYEAEFLGFSYGFRPGRGAHNALDALAVGIKRRKIPESDFSMPFIFGYRFLLSSAIPPRQRDGMETSQVPV